MFAGRLSTELILRSPQYMNACDEYEIDLRGNKVSAIENLGGTENQFDSIDLSDNEIVKLEGFPLLPRLKTILLNNNRITRISKSLETSIPNLETLVLTGNRISNLQDLQNLKNLTKLRRLIVLDNRVVKIPDYRLKVINALPQLKMLDYHKVKLEERKKAETVYENGGADVTMSDAVEEEKEAPKKNGEAKKVDVTAIKAAIANAQTLEEIQRLEAALQQQ
jgi:U2 small nuclear ribonucleoprotein A'